MPDISSLSSGAGAHPTAPPSSAAKTQSPERAGQTLAAAAPPKANEASAPNQANDHTAEIGLAAALVSTNVAYKAAGLDIQFEHDKAAGQNVIKVLDTGTGEVIRQLPPKEMLVLAHAMQPRSYTVGPQDAAAAAPAVRAGQLVNIKT